jgi:multimeric flavodoxin WrbA
MVITAVIGSYRKGNTLKIVRRIEERMQQLGEVEFRYIDLSEVNLSDCRGCFLCISKGETFCPLKDSLLDIEKQLLESDGAIFASPNYACGVTAIMKRLIERFAYIGHRPRFFGRYAAVVATSGGPVGLKQTMENLSYFAGGGFTIVSKLGMTTPPTDPSAKTIQQIEKKINACADKLYHAIKEKRVYHPTFGSMMHFAAFRGMYLKNPALGEKVFPADMKYWREKGWLNKKVRHFQAGKVGILKSAFGLFFETVIGLAAVGMTSKKTNRD